MSHAGGVHFDLVKRVLRDINRSGQGPEEIIQQITDTVFPMYKAFIEPDLNAAQLKIHNSFNPFTGFMNATYILKAARQEELTQQAVLTVLGVGGEYILQCSGKTVVKSIICSVACADLHLALPVTHLDGRCAAVVALMQGTDPCTRVCLQIGRCSVPSVHLVRRRTLSLHHCNTTCIGLTSVMFAGGCCC